MTHPSALFVFLVACAPGVSLDEGSNDTSESTDPDDSGVLDTIDPPACDAPVGSVCGNPSSVIQGQVRLGDGITTTTGDVYIALAHEAYNGAMGGGFHIDTVIYDADLAEPVPFMLDMCEGSAMWSEDNCSYSLQVILDQDGNQGPQNLLPDRGEPSARIDGVRMSCREDAPCLDVVLDCTDGPTCAAFSDLSTCTCEAPACGSDVAICSR